MIPIVFPHGAYKGLSMWMLLVIVGLHLIGIGVGIWGVVTCWPRRTR